MKAALVTSANKGIDCEVARQLAGWGFQITLGARKADAGRHAAAVLAKSEEPRVIDVSIGGGQLADGADGWAPAYCLLQDSPQWGHRGAFSLRKSC